MTIAEAVMITGRRRVVAAASAALRASRPAASSVFANDTTRMLLAVATPTVMIAPISAGTLKVVPERYNIQTIPTSAPGSPVRITNGADQDWKFTTSSRYTSTTAKIRPTPIARKAASMLAAWPRRLSVTAGGNLPV